MKYLYFSAQWCGPCKSLGPIMNEVSTHIPVQKIDVDKDYEMAQKYGVRNVPTVVLVNGDSEITRIIGSHSKQRYLDAIK